jgi:hypothetical protein
MMPWKQTRQDKLKREIKQKVTKVELEGIDFMDKLAAKTPSPGLALRACPYFIVCGRDKCTYYKPRMTYLDKVICSWPVDESGMAGIGVSDGGDEGAITIKPEYLPYIELDPGIKIIELFIVEGKDEDKPNL